MDWAGRAGLSAKHFPGLSAQPTWDRPAEDDPFPWLSDLEAHAEAIGEELRAVCNADVPSPEYCHGEANRRLMERLPGLKAAERSLYEPGFDDRPLNGYVHTVLVSNEEVQPAAALFPRTMAALDACCGPMGVRLVAFGKQLPHTALHWHSDGRNFMLTAHMPLAGPSRRSGARVPPFGPAAAPNFPVAEMREGACGMIMSPLVPPLAAARSPPARAMRAARSWLSTRLRLALRGRLRCLWRRPDDARAVSRRWTTEVPPGAAGATVVFDTTFFHSAYNDGDEAADVLFIDFFHPELTTAEQAAIKHLQRLLRDLGEASAAQGA